MANVPAIRVHPANARAPARSGTYVLYWMTAQRRTTYSFGLQRAMEHVRALGRPLLVAETLGCDGRWATDRHHRFVLEGMADTARRLAAAGVAYYPFVARAAGEERAAVEALAQRAAVVVADDFPVPASRAAVAALADGAAFAVEAVDGNGLLPLRAAEKVFPTAYAFRRFLQGHLAEHLAGLPAPNPLPRRAARQRAAVAAAVRRRYPPAGKALIADAAALANLPIDHRVAPAPQRGGSGAAAAALKAFLADRLERYDAERNLPDREATSGLAPYLHFGHVAAAEVFASLARREGWSPGRLSQRADGRREGWWGVSPAAESFLDQLVTWRELGYNACHLDPQQHRYESLPPWAQATLERHRRDRRTWSYPLEVFAAAGTHDPLWNAAQRQLLREGRIHNYLRMLWGKKILEWSADPHEALETMIELNNRYALDGSDPNSYSGIFWTLGRYDRPWGPERPIFGKVRYMSSENTARKVPVRGYLERYGP